MERAVKVDFFNFTTRRPVTEVLSVFSKLKNPLKPQDRGLHGYHLSFTSADGVTVLYSVGRPDVHVQITGCGCDALRLGDLDVVNLLVAGDHVTRMDIAIDCIGSGFTCSDIWRVLQRGDFVSVSSDIRQIEGLLSRGSAFERINRGSVSPKEKTRTNAGHTIYVGSSASDRMVRIYDKGAESGTCADWLRFEIQLRRDSANEFHRLLRNGGDLSDMGLRLLNKQVRLLDEGERVKKECNHDYIPLILPFWLSLVDTAEVLKLCIPKAVKTVQSTLKYVKNAAASIKALRGVMDDFEEFFTSILDNAKLKDSHLAMQDAFMGHDALYFPACCQGDL
jgi:DNA relaxase NicK